MKKAIAIYDCTADEHEELSFKEGDILIDIKESNEDGWYEGRLEGTSIRGLFPYNYVKFINEPAAIPQPATHTNDQHPLSDSMSPPSLTWSVISSREEDAAAETQPTPASSSSTSMRPPPAAVRGIGAPTAPSNSSDVPFKAADAFDKVMMQQKPASRKAKAEDKPAAASKPAELRKISISSPSSVASRVRSFSTSAAQHNDTSSSSKSPDTMRPRNNSNAMPIIGPKPYTTKSTAPAAGWTAAAPKPSMMNRPVRMGASREQRMEKVIFDNDVVEDDDGYQVVTPSLLRQRQPAAMITPKPAAFSSKPASPAPPSKMVGGSKPAFASAPPSSRPSPVPSPAQQPSTSSRLADIPAASNPAPKLPSRPVSGASRRRPRSSRSTTTTLVTPEKKPAPPAPHPKPVQLAKETLPRAAKGRSVSNPPPLQPKPSFSSKPSSVKPEVPVQSKPEAIRKPPPPPPAAAAAAPPPSSTATPLLPVRPVAARREQFEQLDDLTSHRARSKSNGWKPTAHGAAPLLPARTNTPASQPQQQRQPPPPPPPATEPPVKKTPPPPPPSRPVQQQGMNRYEELFNAINDDGVVDGQTAKIIWRRSKISDDELARIWQKCDPTSCGLLDKAAFIRGMREIDMLLDHPAA